MVFVDMPGAERLTMDPELLRLREGPQLNKGLLSFAAALRELGEAGAAGGAPLSGWVSVENSILTRLLAGTRNTHTHTHTHAHTRKPLSFEWVGQRGEQYTDTAAGRYA